MLASGWKTALIDISESDTLSNEVDLGSEFDKLTVLVPTITSSTITIHVAKSSGDTYHPIYKLKQEAVADTAQITTAETTSKAVTFNIGGVRYVKVSCGSAQQTTDKTFYVQGYN